MFRKVVLNLMLLSSLSFAMSATMVQTIAKDKLGCIKGLGLKRVQAITEYRKTHTIGSLDELLNVKGIGKGILRNIKEDREKKVCTKFHDKKSKKIENRKKDIRAE
jgi:competence protein ComEA